MSAPSHRTPGSGTATSLGELARLFLRLGATAFGGPAVHIALMEEEVVRRRGWLTREQFLDYLGATHLIPGPNSTELALHIGHARAGWSGLFVAGVCFIVPAMSIITGAAWAYERYGALPDAAAVLSGVKPVVVAIVIVALWSLARSAIRTWSLALLGLAATFAVASGAHELAVLGVSGAFMGVFQFMRATGTRSVGPFVLSAIVAFSATATAAAPAGSAVPFGLPWLFFVFAKAGAVLFGSGYVLFAFLRVDLVERLGWLTEPQLLDAIAIGQMVPGPVFTTATFIGYVLGGPVGALVATLGIFLPAFIFVALSGPLVPRLRRSLIAGAVLDGVIVASLALMGVVSWYLGRAAFVDVWSVAVAAASVIAIAVLRVNSAWLMAMGAAIGWMTR